MPLQILQTREEEGQEEEGRGQGDKWQLPGWRIEQKYSQGVLIGNWSEDRLGKFHRGKDFGNSTNREAFRWYQDAAYRPDASTRRNGVLRNNGLGQEHIFVHHGKRYMRNNISSYDQEFCRRHSTGGTKRWDRHRLAWLPEASDHPLLGPPTRFGLKEAIERRVKQQKEIETHGDFHTTYSTSFRSPPERPSPSHRHATPRHLSSHLHPHRVNHHLHLRGKPQIIVPETVDSTLLHNRLTATV